MTMRTANSKRKLDTTLEDTKNDKFRGKWNCSPVHHILFHYKSFN